MKPDTRESSSAGLITRRKFMTRAVAAAAAIVGSAQALTAGAPKPLSVKISAYSYLALSRQVGSTFTLRTPKGRANVVLTQVAEDRCDAFLQQYTARFHVKGKRNLNLSQEVYELHHRKLGNLSLLLSPTTIDGQETLLATFSHLKS